MKAGKDSVQAWPLKVHLLSKFPAFWWSLKHAHTDTTVTPNTHTLTQAHTHGLFAWNSRESALGRENIFRRFPRRLQPHSKRHTGHRCFSQLYGTCGFVSNLLCVSTIIPRPASPIDVPRCPIIPPPTLFFSTLVLSVLL